MAKAQVLKFKQGDDFKLDFTLTDTNSTTSVNAFEVLQAESLALKALTEADPQDPAAILAQEIVLQAADDVYEAAILMDITGWTVASQLRFCGNLIQDFTIDMTQQAIGKFAITADAADTQLWIPRKYDMDIQFTRLTGKISSETFILEVEKDVTNV